MGYSASSIFTAQTQIPSLPKTVSSHLQTSYLAPKIAASFWAPNWYPKPRESQPDPNPLPFPGHTRYLRSLARLYAEFYNDPVTCPYKASKVLDGKPVIGSVPGLSNVFLATGHEGGGLSMGLGTAEMVADMVLGNPGTIDHAPFVVQGRCC